tara:strand:- start:229 stop:537 length:309 start_codon:yes stop_codon:yes gene_type:complete
MKKVQKTARRYIFRLIEAQLKDYRKREDSDRVEELIEKALDKNSEKDVDVSFHGQHYGWFVWNPEENKHEQKDLNDFEKDDTIKDVREFVQSLDKIDLEDYA